MSIANVLSIAGTDPSGGAGLFADLKSFSALGVYGMGAITALTAQNTQGVAGIHRPSQTFLAQQLNVLADDVRIDAVKTGMLFDTDIIEVVAAWLDRTNPPIVVLDPVMVATSGDALLQPEAEDALTNVVSQATVITPNIPELAVLASRLGEQVSPATTIDEALAQAVTVANSTGTLVVAKGGHVPGGQVVDALVMPDGTITQFHGPRVDTNNTHGTGCSLSSAMAALAAKDVIDGRNLDWKAVLARAKHWMTVSLLAADELSVGNGHGPIHHFAYQWAQAGTEPRLNGDQLLSLWWDRIGQLRKDIDALDFVRALGDGTLAQERFITYQIQDALYLSTYARVLASAAAIAPDRSAQAFWAKGANECIEVEMTLHDAWIPEGSENTPMDAVTTGYTNHLLSRAQLGHYGELIAAILPCYWLYQDIGDRLTAHNHPDHTFHNWLTMYGDPAFAEATLQAKTLVVDALDAASDTDRKRMWEAFYESCIWEYRFFDR
ncbi:bifunctional hydroxymethylpyrimidine kinase/phosphomethylpyrimidine kinase [Stomatohabitans albus]|uniref:bifunctional hydroxymethylpyrimidine kinase/phosphomethylpyrimidine kinase n=1 Tax=Stomatohabitans albus TaxID=3110766 RepID=UPI00300C1D91